MHQHQGSDLRAMLSALKAPSLPEKKGREDLNAADDS